MLSGSVLDVMFERIAARIDVVIVPGVPFNVELFIRLSALGCSDGDEVDDRIHR